MCQNFLDGALPQFMLHYCIFGNSKYRLTQPHVIRRV
jgi:hypothetical protein